MVNGVVQPLLSSVTMSGEDQVPATRRARRLLADSASCSGPGDYEFTEKELDALCRWFSAMKYAFPGTEGVMIVFRAMVGQR